MRFHGYQFDKKLFCATVLALGAVVAGSAAFAQAGTGAIGGMPPLPSLPSVPVPDSPSGMINNNANKNANDSLAPVIPPLPEPQLKAEALTAPVVGSATPIRNPAGDKEVPAEGGQVTPAAPSGATPAPLTMPPIPGLEAIPGMPAGVALPAPTNASAEPTVPMLEAPTTLPEVTVAVDKPKEKTWLSKLAPTSFDRTTNFNYKREVLPQRLYDSAYNEDNQHLPLRRTRADYEVWLFASVGRNDIDATRALLSAGTNINALSPLGETPLAVAERIGAMEVAALLKARGAKQ